VSFWVGDKEETGRGRRERAREAKATRLRDEGGRCFGIFCFDREMSRFKNLSPACRGAIFFVFK